MKLKGKVEPFSAGHKPGGPFLFEGKLHVRRLRSIPDNIAGVFSAACYDPKVKNRSSSSAFNAYVFYLILDLYA